MTQATVSDPVVKMLRVETREGPETFPGYELGFGTSRRDSHLHPPGRFVAPGTRCSGCRWSEVKIMWSTRDESYVISMTGKSIVPGEEDKVKLVWAKEPDDVIDALLVPPRGNRSGSLELPQANADSLDEAAHRDPRLAAAFADYESGDAEDA